MRKAQASAALLLAVLVSVSAWSAPPAEAVLSEAQARKAEIDIELAWLSDPATFACQLSVCWRGTLVELSGMVPDEPVRQRVIALAQQHSPLPVLDKLTVLPGSALEVQPCNRDALCRTAVTRLAKAFGKNGLAFDINADAKGQLTVAGVIPSYQEKLDVSRRLSQLPGCSGVINKLEVQPQSKAGRSYAAVTADSELQLPIRPASLPAPTAKAPATLPPTTPNQTAKPMTLPEPMAKAPATLPPAAPSQVANPMTAHSPMAKAPTTLPPAAPTTNQAAKPMTPPAPMAKAPSTLPTAAPSQVANPMTPPAPMAKAPPTLPTTAPTTNQAAKSMTPPAPMAKAPPTLSPAALAASQAAKPMTPPQVAVAKGQAPAAKTAQPNRQLSLWGTNNEPTSPYALNTKTPAPAAKTEPTAPLAMAAKTQPVAPPPQSIPKQERAGQPLATAGTPSSPRPQGPVAMAGTPSPGPRPAEERSFVPTRPEPAGVVPASHQQAASTAGRPTVLPTGYQVNATKEEAPAAKTTASRPTVLPAGQQVKEDAPAVKTAAPAPRPLPPSVMTPPAPPKAAPPTGAAPKTASQTTSPYANRPNAPAPATRNVQPAMANELPTDGKMVQPASAPPAPRATPLVLPATDNTAERMLKPAPPAPRSMMMPATANVAPTNAAAPTSPRPAPRLDERLSSRPTTPDITPGLLSHIRQRVSQVSAGKARDVQIQKVASDRMKIRLKVDDPKEGEKLAAKVLAITELGPFQVDLEVQLGDDK